MIKFTNDNISFLFSKSTSFHTVNKYEVPGSAVVLSLFLRF